MEDKIELCHEFLEFHGHRLIREGVQADPEIIGAITDAAAVQSFYVINYILRSTFVLAFFDTQKELHIRFESRPFDWELCYSRMEDLLIIAFKLALTTKRGTHK